MPRKYLGPIPHPAIGVRIPDIVIPPVLKAFKMRDVAGTLMLSYHRETAPSDVISTAKHILLGHSGTSISEYISKSERYANELGVLVEVEADHVSLMSSPEKAIKRITSGEFEYGLTEEEIRSSLNYIEREFKEVRDVDGVDFVTLDTCELIDLSVDKLDDKELIARYEGQIESDVRRELKKKYLGKRFRFFLTNGSVYEIKFNDIDVARYSLKFMKSIEYLIRLYEIVKKYNEREFGVEIALDEVPQLTKPKELFFYLNELADRGLRVDFVAPNIGFKKREDYDGDLKELGVRVDVLNSIAKSFGALISIHSGSGSHPYSDKGLGVWETIRSYVNGMVKYKVSGVYIQLLLEVMSKFPRKSKVRELYDEIYEAVLETLRRYIKEKSGLYSPHLEDMIRDYDMAISKDPSKVHDPRMNVFRHYFFLFQALVKGSSRYLREKLIELYSEDKELRETYEREAIDLTLRIIDKLGFRGNYVRYRMLLSVV